MTDTAIAELAPTLGVREACQVLGAAQDLSTLAPVSGVVLGQDLRLVLRGERTSLGSI